MQCIRTSSCRNHQSDDSGQCGAVRVNDYGAMVIVLLLNFFSISDDYSSPREHMPLADWAVAHVAVNTFEQQSLYVC